MTFHHLFSVAHHWRPQFHFFFFNHVFINFLVLSQQRPLPEAQLSKVVGQSVQLLRLAYNQTAWRKFDQICLKSSSWSWKLTDLNIVVRSKRSFEKKEKWKDFHLSWKTKETCPLLWCRFADLIWFCFFATSKCLRSSSKFQYQS